MSISSRLRVGAAIVFAVALALAGGAAGAKRQTAAPDDLALARLRTIEFETALAREPKIYLVLDPASPAPRHQVAGDAPRAGRDRRPSAGRVRAAVFQGREPRAQRARRCGRLPRGPATPTARRSHRSSSGPTRKRKRRKSRRAAPAGAAAPAKKKPDETDDPDQLPRDARQRLAALSSPPSRRGRASSGDSPPRSATAGSGCAARSRSTRRSSPWSWLPKPPSACTTSSAPAPKSSSCLSDLKIGGGGGIRTPGIREDPAVFKTAAIDHSATPPCEDRQSGLSRGVGLARRSLNVPKYVSRSPRSPALRYRPSGRSCCAGV